MLNKTRGWRLVTLSSDQWFVTINKMLLIITIRSNLIQSCIWHEVCGWWFLRLQLYRVGQKSKPLTCDVFAEY